MPFATLINKKSAATITSVIKRIKVHLKFGGLNYNDYLCSVSKNKNPTYLLERLKRIKERKAKRKIRNSTKSIR